MSASKGTFTGGTVIQAELHIKGGLVGKGNVTIVGEVEGNIDVKGHCHIADGGKVKGDVHAKAVTVKGTVEGNIYAHEKVMVQESAKVEGNVSTPSIYIAEGASLNGAVTVDKSLSK